MDFYKSDCTELSGKTRGGRICFYLHEGWCTDVTVVKKSCSPHLETIFRYCKPFYSPREFSSFILVGVYIHPQACVSGALQHLADQITNVEQKHPDPVLIILGDFNRANLSHELPVIRNAYRSVLRADLGLSDHCLVHVSPTYRQKLKPAKPAVMTVRRWTDLLTT